ncbi:hypothetical protein EZS27_025568 [termite gut metagenome]|uniref:Uncharacterized protein n=1 Tax=termite gut metagenome TaxID=433724 RepID=A0A5J4QVI2_9ZZZZ
MFAENLFLDMSDSENYHPTLPEIIVQHTSLPINLFFLPNFFPITMTTRTIYAIIILFLWFPESANETVKEYSRTNPNDCENYQFLPIHTKHLPV